MSVFVFGAGYSGKAFGRQAPEGVVVHGTTRSAEKAEALRQAGIAPLIVDGALDAAAIEALKDATHLLVSAAPGDEGDPLLAMAGAIVPSSMPRLEWIGYLSTVGVYGDHAGAWVDETAECRPTSRRSTLRVAAERQWLDLGDKAGIPTAILRLSGIYGPGRNALVNLQNGTAKRLVKPGQVFNRIHVEDIAGAAWHLLGKRKGGVFNVTDDLPAPPQDVVSYAAELMGIAPPAEIAFETAQLSPMARSFYGENKRVSNAAIKAEGYAFRFPDYRIALNALWRDGTWKGEGGDERSAMREG